MSKTLLTAVTLDARWAGARPQDIVRAATRLDAVGVDLLILGGPVLGLDPLILASWLTPRLKQAGLVASLPVLHTLPFHAARALSALDFMTQGRSGWAPTTLHYAEQAVAVGAHACVADDEALAKAMDFIDATGALWDSWDADALVIDKASGVYLNSDRVRRVYHRGPYFQVMGPLNAARPPQGHPVLVQSAAAPLCRALAGQADVILAQAAEPATFSQLRAAVAEAGGQARLMATIGVDDERTPTEAGDWIQNGLEAGVIDGTHWAPADPASVEIVINAVIPDLRRRGVLPSGAKAGTLRVRLGLADHENSGPPPQVFISPTAA